MRVDLCATGRDRNLAFIGIVNRVFTRDDAPFAPGSNDRQFGCESFESQFKTYLVVALASAAMLERIATSTQRNLDLLLRDDRAGERSAEQVFVFINSAGL